jgi:hypothetical protein
MSGQAKDLWNFMVGFVACLCVTRALAVLRSAGGDPAVVAPAGAVLPQLAGEDELERARR